MCMPSTEDLIREENLDLLEENAKLKQRIERLEEGRCDHHCCICSNCPT